MDLEQWSTPVTPALEMEMEDREFRAGSATSFEAGLGYMKIMVKV